MNTLKKLTANHPGKLVKPILFTVFANLANMAPFGMLALVVSALYSFYAGVAPLNMGQLWLYALGMVICMLAVWVFESLSYRYCYRGAYASSTDARAELAEHIRKLPLGTLLSRDPGAVASTMTSDFLLLEEAGSQLLPQIIAGSITPLLACIGLSFFDPRMSLAMFAGFPIALLIIWAVSGLERNLGQRHSEARVDMSGRVSESLFGMPVIKAYNLRGENFAKLDKSFRRFMKENIKLEGGLGPFFLVAIAFLKAGVSLITLAGVYLIRGGTLTVPVFAVFLLAGTRVFDPLAVAVIKFGQLKYNVMAGERVTALLDLPVMEGSGAAANSCDIRFEDVHFGYGDTAVLQGVSASFMPGTLTAIIGPSGGGKSTVLRMVARFYDPQKGRVLFGGRDMREMDPEKLLKNISVVFQDVYLFEDTIAANIGYGREGASREEIMEAAKLARCHDFIAALPDGFDTMVGEGGSTLSGGEKQRISIARAMLKNAPVILLDEATSSLDPENEAEVQKAIARLVQGRTVIMIAHRLKTVVRADNILVLDGGRIVEQGQHDALLVKQGLYSRLWSIQSETEGWRV